MQKNIPATEKPIPSDLQETNNTQIITPKQKTNPPRVSEPLTIPNIAIPANYDTQESEPMYSEPDLIDDIQDLISNKKEERISIIILQIKELTREVQQNKIWQILEKIHRRKSMNFQHITYTYIYLSRCTDDNKTTLLTLLLKEEYNKVLRIIEEYKDTYKPLAFKYKLTKKRRKKDE